MVDTFHVKKCLALPIYRQAITTIRESDKKKPYKEQIYPHLQKDEKYKDLQLKRASQYFNNVLLLGKIYIKFGSGSFYVYHDDAV